MDRAGGLRRAIRELGDHPWFCRVVARLGDADREVIEDFISRSRELELSAFEMAVNRMFLDRERPRRWREIMELLTVANQAEHDARVGSDRP